MYVINATIKTIYYYFLDNSRAMTALEKQNETKNIYFYHFLYIINLLIVDYVYLKNI